MSLISLLSDPIDLLKYSPTELCGFAFDERHKAELLKDRRRVQVKFNVQKLRLRRRRDKLQSEVFKLKNEIETLKKKTEELKNFNADQ